MAATQKKRPLGFFKTTLLGAVLVVVPVGIVAFALWQIFKITFALIQPIIPRIPLDSGLAKWCVVIAAILIVVLGCYLVGVVVRTRWGGRLRAWIESRFLDKIPGYSTVRSLAHQYIGESDEKKFRPVMVALYDMETRVIALEIEDMPGGMVAVFVPSSPAVTLGQVHIVPGARVFPLDASMHATIEAVAMFGEGAGELVESYRRGSKLR